MAKKKENVKVEVIVDMLILWADDIERHAKDIQDIEGITQLSLYSHAKSLAHVHCDPRYDINEIAQELKKLLNSEIPNIFKEEFRNPTHSILKRKFEK